MNLKKTYTEKYGYERVVTDRNSALMYAELDFLKLRDGDSYTIDEPGKEFALVILYGKCSVKGENFSFDEAGKRADLLLVDDQLNLCTVIARGEILKEDV